VHDTELSTEPPPQKELNGHGVLVLDPVGQKEP
jgi:hypothetical protein